MHLFTKKFSIAAAMAMASLAGASAHAQSQAPDAFQHLNTKIAVDYVLAKDKSEYPTVETSKGARLTLSAQKDVFGIKDAYVSLQSQVLLGDEFEEHGVPGDETYALDSVDLAARSFELRLGKGLRLERSNVLLTPYVLAGKRSDTVEYISSDYSSPAMTRDQTYYGLGAMAQVAVAPGLFLTADVNVSDSKSLKFSYDVPVEWEAPVAEAKWHTQASVGLTYFVDKDLSLSAHYKLVQSKYREGGINYAEKASHLSLGLAYHF